MDQWAINLSNFQSQYLLLGSQKRVVVKADD